MANVIREDVVKLDFDIGSSLKEIKKLQDDINELKKKLTGAIDNGAFDDLKEDANETVKPLRKVKEQAEKIKEEFTSIGKKAATVAFNGLKKVAGISFKTLLRSAGLLATAVGKIAYESVQASAEYEQLKGGMEKIFDQANISQIARDANNAYEELGISANQYLSIINDTGANFAATMGDQKGYDTARTGLGAISDYASGTGKSVDLLSEKFAMITRSTSSYQSIADQFSGILPATSADFLKQAKAAGFLDNKYSELTKVPIAEYQEAVAKMLEKGVKAMGLAGNTADEATGTVSGSLGMMKAAWQDMLVSFGTGENFDDNFDKLVYSVVAFGDNVIPVAERALTGIATAVEKLAPVIAEKFPDLAEKLLPPLIKATVSLTKGLIKALPNIIKTVAQSIVDIFGEQFPIIKKIGDFFKDNAKSIGDSIIKVIPIVLGLVAAFKGFNAVKSISSLFGGGKSSGGSSNGGGIFGGLINTFKSLAKTQPTVILKGLANLAIIMGGFSILTAAFVWVAPFIAKLGDTKSIIKLLAIMTALGLVAGALTNFAGVVGKIPVTTVALGLANMAIMLVGVGALSIALAWVANKVSGMIDVKSILKLVAIMTAVGAVGTVLGVFAGIVGAIPIPVVLAGLANIALVLGGLSALIVAFGALTQVDGFTNFITKGGEILTQIFEVIGQMVGSLVGGVLESISNVLPAIGKNIAAFAENIKPLFTLFSGVNMAGIGDFFVGLAAFIGAVAVDKVMSFFGGKTDFSGVATGLGQLASDDVKKFFAMVQGIDPLAYENGKKFFDCLDGISKLPNVGGIGQMFSGENDFEGVASGLKSLTGEGVKKFFAMVAGMESTSFDNAKAFFNCLDGISKLPNVGGIGQIFTGENDFSGVAAGLKALSGQGVKNFFAMVAGLDSSTFEKTSELFASLSDIGEVGKKGFFEKLGNLFSGGEETTSPLSAVADGLSDFAEKSKTFFEQVNNLDLGKLNGLWNSLKKSEEVTTNISEIVDKNITKLVDKIKELPVKMGDGLKSAGQSLADAFVEIWTDAVKASVKPVNKLLSGANWVLKEFGSEKKVISWTPYAKGTGGHRGGNALVNDGRGAELVQMPNGRMFIPNGRNVFLPNAPKGMKVLPAERTAQLLGRKSPTFRYADGIGDIDIWSYYDNSEGLVSKITDGISYEGMSSLASNIGRGIVSTFSGAMPAWIDKLFEENGQSLASYVASKGVTQWLPTVVRALKMEGQYSASNVARTLFQMKTESGGNPKAINLWDSNAKKGIPSKGLMQVIDPTFKAYARAGFNKNIYDPLSNILASVRYATARYGSLSKAYRGVGYSKGVGTIDLPTQSKSVNMSYTPESDARYYSSNVVEYNTYSPQFSLTISGTHDDREMAHKVKRWVSEAIDDAFDSMNSKTARLQEV